MTTKAAQEIWPEKYRPQTLDDVRGNEAIINRMKDYVNDDTMPNVLLAGQQGIGKTTVATAFAKDKYGDDWQSHFMDMNASDARGIDVVRNRVKEFAGLSTVSDQQFKIVFLDEADNLTSDAQPALRRIMEDFHDRTRFILSCNYPDKIIDPIQSRCDMYWLSPLDEQQMFDFLEHIATSESLTYSPDQLEQIVRIADGDGRKGITTLYGTVKDGEVHDEYLDAKITFPDRHDVKEVFDLTLEGEHEAMSKLDDIIARGVDTGSLCSMFLTVIQEHEDLNEDQRAKMIDLVGDLDWRLMNGANPNVQLNSFLANIRVAQHANLSNYE